MATQQARPVRPNRATHPTVTHKDAQGNVHKGEVAFEVQGKRYVLRPDFNAMCTAEDLMKMTTAEIMVQCSIGNMRATRAVLWAYLQAKHKDEFPSLESVGTFVNRAGMDEIIAQLQRVVDANQPVEGTAAGNGAGPGRPQDAVTETGTGVGSSSQPAASV